jgi:hypothetical protein
MAIGAARRHRYGSQTHSKRHSKGTATITISHICSKHQRNQIASANRGRGRGPRPRWRRLARVELELLLGFDWIALESIRAKARIEIKIKIDAFLRISVETTIRRGVSSLTQCNSMQPQSVLGFNAMK